MFLFRSPPPTISHSSLYSEPLSRFPSGTPMETPVHRTLYIPSPENSPFPQSPVREPPPCFLTGSTWTGILRHQSHWSVYAFIHVCLPESPKRSRPTYGKNIRSPSTESHAHGKPTYNGVWPGSPRGSLVTLLSLSQCHAAFGTISSALAWVDQSPVSQRVS